MPSFDVVSEVDLQEVKNAVDQVQREIKTRYDFKDTKSEVELKESLIIVNADDKMRLGAIQDLVRQKLAKRGVSLKSVEFKPELPAGGDMLRQEIVVKQGLEELERKRITKALKDQKIKVNAQIQGDQVRITSKQRDDLQDAIAFLRKTITDIELQFTNFRE